MRLLGLVLVTAGCLNLGISKTLRLGERVNLLVSLSDAMEEAARELRLRATPLPELMERLGRKGEPIGELFVLCGKALEKGERGSFEEIWRECLTEAMLPFSDEERALAENAGSLLGRYARQEQADALMELACQLRERSEQVREEQRRLGRVYCAAGACGGLLLGILLV